MVLTGSTSGSWFQPWSLRRLVADLQSGRTSTADVLERCRARLAETESEVHAWVDYPVVPDDAPGDGLASAPIGVKDIIDLSGYPTKCGSSLRAGIASASRTASIVDAWVDAGALPIGKTVTTEFGYFAPGPTTNPAAPGHTPGGSSSGSAAAVAAGQVPLALGAQTAGSVTRPAAFCGVASLVMSHGRYPGDGVVGLSPSLDSHGFFAAGTSDLAFAWSALTGEEDVCTDLSRPPRLLLWSAAPLGVTSKEMTDALGATALRLTAAGATVDPFPLEDLVADCAAAHPVVMAYEAARERAAELARADQLSAPLTQLLRSGERTSEADYAAARGQIDRALDRVLAVMKSYDAIIGPGAPGAAPRGLEATGDPVLSRPWQAMGLPAVCVPGLRNAEGLPLGLQLLGAPNCEAGTLRTACWVERHL